MHKSRQKVTTTKLPNLLICCVLGKNLTTYAGKKVTIGAGHFQIIDFFYDW